jgi:pectate lyase
MASNDVSPADSVARITFHHNYFYNCGSRLPLIRFGKAHIFNNYYKDCDDAINTRMNAWVRVERNYFEGVGKAVYFSDSPITGEAQLIDNHFGTSYVGVLPPCDLQVFYPYTLDPTDDVPRIIRENAGPGIHKSPEVQPRKFVLSQNYPNPFNPITKIEYTIPNASHVTLKIVNLLGQVVATLVDEKQDAKRYTKEFDASRLSSGVYFYQIKADGFLQTKKMTLIK